MRNTINIVLCGSVNYKKSTVMELDCIQNMIGRFILQVPASTSRALAWIDAGLMPIEYRILNKQALFIYNILKTKRNPILLKI